MLPALIAFAVLILGFEIAAWMLFKRKISGLAFAPAEDGSSLPFFTLQRLRIIAVLHTLIMLACALLTLVLLW